MSLVAHWPSGTNTSQASPSHTPTTPAVRLCVSVCMCACVPPRRGTTLSKCHRRVSVKPCCASHPHSRLALLRRRRLHIECNGRHVVFVYSPHAKTHRGFPPARTRPATSASPSLRPPVCALLYLFIHTLPGFDQLLVTNRGVRHCNQPEKGGLLSRSVVSDTLKYTDWTPSQLIRICPRDSLLQVWLRNSLLRDVKAFTPSRCG